MRLSHDEAWERLADSPSAVLATIDEDGAPHLVPFVYAPLGTDTLVSAVDDKPKSSRRLRRLDNIDRDPRVTILADHYAADWSQLWWVRAEGTAVVSESAPHGAADGLRGRYPAYADQELGPWVVVTIGRLTGWSASG